MWNKLTIFQKGLVLIAAPLFFQIGFFVLLADMQNGNTRVVNWSIHSKEVLRQTQVVLRDLLELGTGMRGFILAADPDLKAAYDQAAQQLPRNIVELQNKVGDSQVQTGQVEAIAEAIEGFMAWHAETMRLSGDGHRDDAIARAKSPESNRLYNGIVDTMRAFIQTEDTLDREHTVELDRSRSRQEWMLWIGAGLTFLSTLALAFIFGRSISGRLATLTSNAELLVAGKQLAPPVRGSDEVAQLDRAFRQMAREIDASAQSLRTSAEEIRGLYHQAKASEEEIRGLNENLERRINERTLELAGANEALREADRRKDDFLAMLAHELRNPLAPVRNALQILKLPGVEADCARQARDMIERQVFHMVRLVDDLLDVSRVMRGKIELRKERVDLAAVLARAVETARLMLDARGQELVVSAQKTPVWVEGDLVRLSQVVSNLLVNAAKFSDKIGQIWLQGKCDGSEAVVSVRDSGIGIDADLLPRIFDPFVQADRSLARSQGGLGIGLTLVKHLVQMHDGTVAAASTGEGAGSEFTIRLPAVAHHPATPESPAEACAAASGPSRRVLVVDDNVDAAESAAMILRFSGHEVRVAYDGHAALEMVHTFRPEVVLLDIGLPGLSGYDVARSLRANRISTR